MQNFFKNEFKVVELLDVIPHGMGLVLVMEFLPLSLYEMLHDVNYTLNDSEVKCYMKMFMQGLKYMHDNSIMHRVKSNYHIINSLNIESIRY